MSQNKGLTCMIQTKLNLINIQKAELLTVLDRFVLKQTDAAVGSLQTEGQTVESLRSVNSNLETVLNLLFKTYENFDGLTEDVPQLRTETSQNVDTSPITPKSQSESPVAVEFNRRLELLEIASTFQDEQNKSLMSAQEKQWRVLEDQVKVWKNALRDVEQRRASEMLTLKLQRDDMEDTLTSLMSNVKSLHEAAKEQHNQYLDTFVDKKMFFDALERSGKTEKLAEQLVGSLEAVEFDVKNVMDWHKELERECKCTNAKVSEMEVRVLNCTEKCGHEEKSLRMLAECVTKLEETGSSEIKPLKESYEKVNQALHLTCRLIATKLQPLDKLLKGLTIQKRNMSSSRVFQNKAKQRFDECEKKLVMLKDGLEQQDSSIANQVLKQRMVCKDDWTSALQRLKGELEKDNTVKFGIYQAGNTTLTNTIKQINKRLDQSELGASDLRNKLDQHDKSLAVSGKDATMRTLMTATSVQLKSEMEARLEKLKAQYEEKMNTLVLDQLQKIKMEIPANGPKSSAGFTASLDGYRNFDKEDIVKPYKVVNKENDAFNVSTGEFVAPCHGTYLSLFTLMQGGVGKITAHVCRLPSLYTGLKMVCKTVTTEHEGTSSAAGYIRLAAGERLALRIISMSDTATLSPYTFFTCCLVSP